MNPDSISRSEFDDLARSVGDIAGSTRTVLTALASQRTPSKANLIGDGPSHAPEVGATGFLAAVARARSRDAAQQEIGKAQLADMGSRWEEPEKATVGADGPSGGYIIPAVVAAAVETSRLINPIRDLFNVITGVQAVDVLIPYEGEVPVRAVVAGWGAVKENVNFTLGRYTATMYTIARIFDTANQLLRHSGGAAEKLVRSKLARAFALGEAYYTLQGSGTNEPKGLLSALAAAAATYTTAHTPADNTVAGSVRVAISLGIEALARRGRDATGVLLNSGDVAHATAQGSDAGGFWVDSGTGGVGLIGLPNVAIRTSVAMPSGTAIAGEFASAEFYVGQAYRVDVSDVAGNRWDQNLTGFRGEEEIAFNADPYVAAGMFQRITGLIP